MKKTRVITHLQLSILISISLFLITLTFKAYFYYVPFSSGIGFLAILQFLTLCGWVTLVAIPPLFLASEFKWTAIKYWAFLLSVSLWTIATLMIKLNTLVNIGTINYQYLTAFPILIYFEWIVPALYIYIATKYYRPISPQRPQRVTNRVRFDDDDEQREPIQRNSRERFDD
jgi:hypothetical protein